MFKPELLSPAGTLKNMRYAFAYGADAVYAGQPRYSCVCATTNSTTKIFSSASMKPTHWGKVLCRGQHCTAQRQAENLYP